MIDTAEGKPPIYNYCLHLQVQAIIVLLYRNSIYNNVGGNKHLFLFLTSGQDCNS